MEGSAMKTMSKKMTLKTTSILCLIMILPGGLASPVAGEGGTRTAGRMELIGSLGYGRRFSTAGTKMVGFINGVEEESLCCEECHKEHPSTEFYEFKYEFTNFLYTSCTCKISKPFVRPKTKEYGLSSGQCGSWEYRGDRPLGEGVYFESGVEKLGDISGRAVTQRCCNKCSKRFPGTRMFTFDKRSKTCTCYGLQQGQTVVTKIANFSAGACEPKSPGTEVTETEIVSSAEVSKPKVEMEDLVMNDTPDAVSAAVTNEEVDGELGDGKIFNPNTMNLVNYAYASASGECCAKCQELQQDARFFIFSKENPQCACLTPIDGLKPATMDPQSGYKNWMPHPVAGVCGVDGSKKEVQLGNLMMADAPAAVSNQGSVAGGIGDGRTLDRDTVIWLQHVPGDSSEECCKGCQTVSREATLYVFSKGHHQCACFTPKEGVQPATAQPDYWIPEPVTGVCV